tara:strand:+ start:7326 stop:8765 length:1440 start_codon:yes stop_codon:yes gene_type:complete
MLKKILLAEKDRSIRTVISRALSRAGHHVRSTSSSPELWKWVSDGQGEIAIIDATLTLGNGTDLVSQINQFRPKLPIIVLSTNRIASEPINDQRNVFKYLSKPFDLDELIGFIKNLSTSSNVKPTQNTKGYRGTIDKVPLLGNSPAMQEIYRSLTRLTNSDLTVIISGESGTGRELLAKALHDYSQRSSSLFVSVKLESVPPELIATEIFGREEGVSANRRFTPGKLHSAENGTLFLDEISNLPLEAQARMLKLLRENTYSPLGGKTLIPSNVRIITATKKNLRSLVAQGLFREDLFYRLNVVPLRLPPLRERVEDIPILLQYFIEIFDTSRPSPGPFSPEAISRLKAYNWPGNVRELKNFVQRVCALYTDELITDKIVKAALLDTYENQKEIKEISGDGLARTIDRHLEKYFTAHKNTLPASGLYERILREIERPLLSRTLAATKGNQIKAAEILGINRNTLRAKIRKLDVRVARGGR